MSHDEKDLEFLPITIINTELADINTFGSEFFPDRFDARNQNCSAILWGANFNFVTHLALKSEACVGQQDS